MNDKTASLLVVDDEEYNRKLMGTLLAAEGHAVRTAASGEEALSAVAERVPDLILLDIMMPDIDGFEVARRLKADPATRAIPIVMVTALEDRESRMHALLAGAEDFLTKPVDHAELLVRVRNLLRLKEYGDFLADHNRILEEQVRQRTALLRASEERYHQLFENMGSGVAIYQPDATGQTFVFKSVNRASERIDQVRREDVVGRNVEQVFSGVGDFGLLEVFRRVSRGGVPERLPASFYRDERIAGWRDNYVYRLDSGEIVAVYDDVTERVEREAQINRLNTALRTLSACNVALVHAKTEEELFQSVCRHIVETGGYLLAWVEYPGEAGGNGKRGARRFGAHFGDEAAYRCHAELATMPEHADRCLSAIALRTRETQVCNDLMEMPKCAFEPLRKAGVAAALALPLLNDGEAYGALTVFSPAAGVFGDAEIKLMEELAGDLAYGVNTLRTRAERDRGTLDLRQALEQTIAAIALTLEKRDPYTAGHQQRVAEIASAIAVEMGLTQRQIEGLRFGALIHDIGKVYVPSEILNRPGKLTDLEFGLIKTHPQVGFDIVKDIPFPWPVARMVHQHHERLDGSGYPLGLKGGDILLEARILAVADVVEAMSSHRPYRAALGIEAAVKELKRGSGALFDPDATDACLRLYVEKGDSFAGATP